MHRNGIFLKKRIRRIDMTNKDIKELGLPNYEEIQRAFMETDHYNHCHRSGIEWQEGAEWMRGIAIDAIKKKEKEMIDKACEYLKSKCDHMDGECILHLDFNLDGFVRALEE